MSYLIDGNNLMHALADAGEDVGRGGVCRLLAVLAERGERMCVVFDGPARGIADIADDAPMEVIFAAPRDADEIILERIAADTAPRRLTVVSSDREIRRAARRRRCERVTSPAFARTLARANRPPERPSQSPEPPEKRRGLTAEQTDAWLEEFGLPKSDQDHRDF